MTDSVSDGEHGHGGHGCQALPAGMMPIRRELGTSAARGWFGSTPALLCVLPIRPCRTSLNMPSPPTQTILWEQRRYIRVPALLAPRPTLPTAHRGIPVRGSVSLTTGQSGLLGTIRLAHSVADLAPTYFLGLESPPLRSPPCWRGSLMPSRSQRFAPCVSAQPDACHGHQEAEAPRSREGQG